MNSANIQSQSGNPSDIAEEPKTRRARGRSLALLISLFAIALALVACETTVGPQGGWSGVTEDGDFLYIGGKDGHVVRVSKDTLTLDQNWKFPLTDDLGEIYSTPVISDGIAYGGGFRCNGNICEGQVFAIELATGTSAWLGEYNVKTKLIGSVGVGDSVLAVGASSIDKSETRGHLLGLALAKDAPVREVWRLPLDGAVWGGVTVADDVAYFGTMGGTFYAVDLSDRSEYAGDVEARVIWSFSAGGAIAGKSLVADGKVYFGSFDESVYALDIASRTANPDSATLDSQSEWSFETGAWVWASPALINGSLYVPNIKGQVFALNSGNGSPLWASPAQSGREAVGQPALFQSAQGPALAVPSGKGDTSVVLISTGQVIGELSSNGKGVKSGPLVSGDTIFAHSDNGQLWRFRADTFAVSGCIKANGDGQRCG